MADTMDVDEATSPGANPTKNANMNTQSGATAVRSLASELASPAVSAGLPTP